MKFIKKILSTLFTLVKWSVPSIEINFNKAMFFLGKSEIGLVSDVVPATAAP
jgi:hypothetical protein